MRLLRREPSEIRRSHPVRRGSQPRGRGLRWALVLACGPVLGACFAMQDFKPGMIRPYDQVGAWIVFRVGNFPAHYRDELKDELAAVPDRMALFRGLVELEWPFEWRVNYLAKEELEKDAPRKNPDFMATAKRLELDAYIIYTVTHYLHHDQNGFSPRINLKAKMVRVRGGRKLWYDSITEAGQPCIPSEISTGALTQNYAVLIERAVRRLMRGLGG